MAVVLLGILYLAKLHSYVLFHTLVEVVFVVVCLSVVIMAATLYQFLDDDFAIFLGAALVAVAALHVAHLADYPGLGLISGSLDPPTQLWLSARFLLAGSLAASAFVIGRRIPVAATMVAFACLGLLVIVGIYWWQVFPVALEQSGLTPFKKVAEYVVCALFVAAGVLLWQRRDRLPSGTWRMLRAALVASIVAEVFFSQYQVAGSWPNMLGHFFLVLSALFLFRAIVDDGLARPHRLAVEALSEAESMHRRLEQGLMPGLPVRRPDIKVVSSYRPGEDRLQLGGDFIDVLDRGAEGVAVICGDVSGHGAAPAALGTMLRASWQALCAGGVDAETMVASLREVIERERRSSSTYATMCLAWLDPGPGELRLVSLGHPLPLVFGDGGEMVLPTRPIPPLGMWDFPVPELEPVPLPGGWRVLFYTDGLIEGRMRPDSAERFGETRLAETAGRLLRDSTDDGALDELLRQVEAAGSEPFDDDVSVILLSQAGADSG